MVRNVVKNRITQNQISFEVMVLEKKSIKELLKARLIHELLHSGGMIRDPKSKLRNASGGVWTK